MTWIQTYRGFAVDFVEPDIKTICIEDIARGLAFQCRYNGHCRKFYSVAQHSVLVSEAIEKHVARLVGLELCGLMHDAAEAYCGDLVAPVKQVLRVVDDLEFDDMEARLMGVIAQRFNLITPFPEVVREYDLRMLATEHRDLFGPCSRDWKLRFEPLPSTIEPWTAELSERRFLERFDELGGQR